MSIEVISVEGIPFIQPGDDFVEILCACAAVESGDILCVASSVWAKAKGYLRALSDVKTSERAERIGEACGEDPRFIQVVLDESYDVIIEHPFVLSKMVHGHVGVRAGVDNSNVEGEIVITLPPDPMKDAAEIREALYAKTDADVRVILTDTCGRAFRRGQTGVAIGWAGMPAIHDYRGTTDLFGRVLEITEEAVVDEFAAFANFMMGESNKGVPAVIFRGAPKWEGHDELYFDEKTDITIRAYRQLDL